MITVIQFLFTGFINFVFLLRKIKFDKHDYYAEHYPSTRFFPNTTFWKLDHFPSSGIKRESGGVEKVPTRLDPFERANLDHCTTREVLIRVHILFASNNFQ